MNILVLGASGLLGSNMYSYFAKDSVVVGTYFTSPVRELLFCDLDISKVEEICVTHNINIIMNCVGLVDIESCEKRPEAAWQINTYWVHQVALLSKKLNIKLVQISTDHYLSDEGEPRDEFCVMYPVNQYGFSKLSAEQICQNTCQNSLVLRVNFLGRNLFGLKDNSLLSFFVKNLQNGKYLTGFDDVFFTPTSAYFVCRAIEKLLMNEVDGIVHIVGAEKVSKFSFAKLLASELGVAQSLISPGKIAQAKGLIPRPSNLALTSKRLGSYIQPESVSDCIREALDLSVN